MNIIKRLRDWVLFKRSAFPEIDSPPDIRDYLVKALFDEEETYEYPEEYEIEDGSYHWHQAASSMCTGCAKATLTSIINKPEWGRFIDFSPAFSYGYRTPDMDSYRLYSGGMYSRDAMLALVKYGMAENAVVPTRWTEEWYAILPRINANKEEIMANAGKYKARAIGKLDYTNTHLIKFLLSNDVPIYTTVHWYSGTRSDYNLTENAIKGKKYGGHAMTMVGYERIDGVEYFKCKNSYGKFVGVEGYTYFEVGYPFKELWVALDDKYMPPERPKLWHVQCGAFRIKGNAQTLLSELKINGYDTFMVKRDDLYKVQCGAFKNKDNAEKLAESITKSGYDTYIVRY